jgi:hypothetical protein
MPAFRRSSSVNEKNSISRLMNPLTVCNAAKKGTGRFLSDSYSPAEMSILFPLSLFG